VVTGYYDQQGMELDLEARVQDLVAGPTGTGLAGRCRADEAVLVRRRVDVRPGGTLSGGERRRLQLLLVIAGRPNVLFLDEPTNDLDLDTLRILEEFLEDWPGALVTVSHDRTSSTHDRRLVAVEAGGSVVGWPEAWPAG